jgi:uncharacterized protein (TIGR02284 family)
MMFENNEHGVKVINSLITTTIDSADGYERSAENVRGTEFERMFSEFAQQRRQLVGRLQEHVRMMEGTPEDDGSIKAGLHRRFEDLKTAITGGSDQAVIEEVERGEDYLKDKYEAALKDDELDPKCRAIIEEAYQLVRAGHDRVSQLKHGLAAN